MIRIILSFEEYPSSISMSFNTKVLTATVARIRMFLQALNQFMCLKIKFFKYSQFIIDSSKVKG